MTPKPQDNDSKGGYCRQEWMAIFARRFEAAGCQPYEAESHALNAWECSGDDADPNEAAFAELSYIVEDSK